MITTLKIMYAFFFRFEYFDHFSNIIPSLSICISHEFQCFCPAETQPHLILTTMLCSPQNQLSLISQRPIR